MDLREPKKKRVGSHIKPQQPFPISIESENNTLFENDICPIFIGNFTGDSVVVCNPEEMVSLYTMGFFGKGSFSRGYPSFEITKKGIPPIIKERQWRRRKLWIDKMEKTLSCPQTQEQSNGSCLEIEKDKLNNGDQSEQNKDTEITTISVEVGETKTTSMEVEENKTTSMEVEENKTTSVEVEGNKTTSVEVEENKTTPMEVEENKTTSVEVEENETTSVEVEGNKTTSVEVEENNSECLESSPSKEQKTDLIKETDLNHSSQNDVTNEIGFQQLKHSLTNSETTYVNSKVLVLADSDDEDIEKVIRNPQPHLEDEQIRTVVEILYLTLEEAFFLSYALGCLHVIDMSGNAMTLSQLWATFCEVKPDFIELYVAYHHFRAKGWVVKTGHKFGGDFLLYKQGPAFYHASYIVIVEKVNSRLEKAKHSLTWTKLHGFNRLAESSGKDIITCQVLFPGSLTSEDLKSPKTLPKFQVNELLTKRWISSIEREEKES